MALPTTDILPHPRASEVLPQAQADTQYPELRGNRYGEPNYIPNLTFRKKAAEEGSLIVGCNATPGTGIAGAIVTAYVATTPLIHIKNTHASRKVYVDKIRLIWTVAPASATSAHVVAEIDSGRTVTGGTPSVPTVANKSSSEVATFVTIDVGALTAAAAAAIRRIGRAVLRSVIAVINDETILVFGGDGDEGALTDLAGATAKRAVVNFPAAVLNPGEQLFIHLFCPANSVTPPSFEYEVSLIQR